MSLKSLGENSRILGKGKEYGMGRIMSPHVFCKDRLVTYKLYCMVCHISGTTEVHSQDCVICIDDKEKTSHICGYSCK